MATFIGSFFSSTSSAASDCLSKICLKITSDKDLPIIIKEVFQAGVITYIAYEGTSECLDIHDIQNWNFNNVFLLTIATGAGVYKCLQIRLPGNFKQKTLGLMLNTAGFVQGLLLRKVMAYCNPTDQNENAICSNNCVANSILPFAYMIFASLNIARGIETEASETEKELELV